MALLGLSIFIASVSFLCYRHPPLSWPFWEWLRRSSLQTIPRSQNDAPLTIKNHDFSTETKEIPLIVQDEKILEPKQLSPTPSTKQELDRKAMPPPPAPIIKKPTSNPTPSLSTTAPTLTLEDTLPPPSFPALNSAQRASGGTRAPQRLPAPSNLMPPPSRPSSSLSPLPNRSPTNTNTNSASSSLAPPPTHNSIPAKPRKKVLLTPGHSPLDWARLSSSPNANLRGLPPNTPYLRVPPSLLKQFTGRKGKDAWTVMGGKVYNLSPYMAYHPGGEAELLRAAGKDGTRLFGEVHPWVNWEGMLEGCLIGIAVEEGDERRSESVLEEMD